MLTIHDSQLKWFTFLNGQLGYIVAYTLMKDTTNLDTMVFSHNAGYPTKSINAQKQIFHKYFYGQKYKTGFALEGIAWFRNVKA